MSTDQRPEARIEIEENYIYDVELAEQTRIDWQQSGGSIRIQVPYDGQKLHHLTTTAAECPLMAITVTPPEDYHLQETALVTLMTGPGLTDNLKSGKQQIWRAGYKVNPPHDTLVKIDGEVFDGASIHAEQLDELILNQLDTFVNPLRLRLSFWVPNLFENAARQQAHELQDMLLQQESDQQIFLAELHADELSRNLVALANSAGGRILIGVNTRGSVIEQSFNRAQVETILLQALLQAKPPLPIAPPDYFKNPDGDGNVVRVVVPSTSAVTYQCGARVYRRDKNTTISESAPSLSSITPPSRPVSNLKELLARGDSQNVIILDAKDLPIASLDLGTFICGMMNAYQPDGLIIIRNLSNIAPGALFALPGSGGRGVLQALEQHLQHVQNQLLPRLTLPRPVLMREDGEQMVILPIPNTLAPVALYQNQGYLWNGTALLPQTASDVFALYLQRVGAQWEHKVGAGSVQLRYGQLAWPIQPPESLEAENTPPGTITPGAILESRASVQEDTPEQGYDYDVQNQHIVWQQHPFEEAENHGWQCNLVIPLDNVLMEIDDMNKAISTAPVLQGLFKVEIDNLLASGNNFHFNFDGSPFKNLPIYKRTRLTVNLKIQAQELFKQRHRTTLLRFTQPNITLDRERVADVHQACSDAEFRIYKKITFPDKRRVVLCGIRTKNYNDILLVVGLIWTPFELNREKHYVQRIDRNTTTTGILDIRILLGGLGENAGKELAEIQLKLYEIISQRLSYLGSE